MSEEPTYHYEPAGEGEHRGNPEYLNHHPNAEVDPSRAHDMANGSDDVRTIAADDRREAEEHAQEEQRALARLEEMGDSDSSLRDDYQRDAKNARHDKEESLSSAESWDLTADAREEWAGILHDYPVSEQYREAHPEVSFTSEGMLLVEDYVRRLEEDHTSKKELEKIDRPDWGSKIFPTEIAGAEEDEAHYLERIVSDVEPGSELAALLDNPAATMGEIKEYFRNKAQEYLSAHKNNLERLKKVLEDVKTGKAAEYAGEEPAEENHDSGDAPVANEA
jgi:TusA-related sulfurtransferase